MDKIIVDQEHLSLLTGQKKLVYNRPNVFYTYLAKIKHFPNFLKKY